MSIEFKEVCRKNPQDLNSPPRYYARKAAGGESTLSDLIRDILKDSTLTEPIIIRVITALCETIPEHLGRGNIVRLGDLGSLSFSFGSLPCDNEKEINGTHIINRKLIYQPSPYFRQKMAEFEFKKVD